MTKTTVSPDYDHQTRTRTYHVTVAWPAGSNTAYGFATHAAAQAAGERMAQDVPAEQPVCARSFRVAGAGRLMGR